MLARFFTPPRPLPVKGGENWDDAIEGRGRRDETSVDGRREVTIVIGEQGDDALQAERQLIRAKVRVRVG
jgi:hypothetical protein